MKTFRLSHQERKPYFIEQFGSDAYLKKSSLQNSCPFLAKHLSVNWTRQSQHCRHLACHVLSATFRMNLSRISSWQPPHFGIVAVNEIYINCYCFGVSLAAKNLRRHSWVKHKKCWVDFLDLSVWMASSWTAV